MPDEWAYVALGSNLGERETYLRQGRQALAALPETRLVAASRIEETAPIGPPGQGPYLNQMVLLRTGLSAHDLLAACHAIERDAGRMRGPRWGPRTLDLDLVRYGELSMDQPDLTLPHPELARRDFWQRELEELTPHAR
jgi:2-amino-4-hydroxy-6-hydroxymethyldihydropteridine diphosphokinase